MYVYVYHLSIYLSSGMSEPINIGPMNGEPPPVIILTYVILLEL